MVNTGRPSPACKACRARRLKCDQTKPACIKCTKAKRVCPGYREAFEVNFKDQTESVIRRHERAKLKTTGHKLSRSQNSRSSSPSGSSDISAASSSDTSPTSTVSRSSFTFKSVEHHEVGRNTAYHQPGLSVQVMSLDTVLPYQATCYFMSTFVNVRTHSPTANLGFLSGLVKSTPDNGAFHTALLAVSMAALASRPNPGALVPLARGYYNKALVQISKTMSDKEKSKEDQSLAAIIMLIFYEILIWDNPQDSVSCHITGAQAIIKLRGPAQRKSPMGNAMFEFLRGFMIHQYAHAPKPNVDEMMWWVKEGGSRDQPNHVLQGLNVETTVLRKQLVEFLSSKPDSFMAPIAVRIYRKAKKLEAQVRTWFDTTADARMRTVEYSQGETPDETIHQATAFPGNVYTFDNIFIAAKYLSVHLHWLMLAEIMANITNWVQNNCVMESITAAQRAQAVALAQEQIAEVIAIAPYYCKWPTYNEPSPFGAMTCSFPLFVAGSSAFTTKKQRTFLIGRLKHLSSAAGLKSSARFASLLKALNSHESRFQHPNN